MSLCIDKLPLPVMHSHPAITVLALRIADEAARSDVEVNCTRMYLVGQVSPTKRDWWDTTAEHLARDPNLTDTVARSVAYLEMRELIERHAEFSGLVRFKEHP